VTLEFVSEDTLRARAVLQATRHFVVQLNNVPESKEDPARKAKELDQLDKNISSLERQLSDEAFLAKAPPKIVEGMRTKLAEYKAKRAKLS
jgi:valyl-tRNA synthetase